MTSDFRTLHAFIAEQRFRRTRRTLLRRQPALACSGCQKANVTAQCAGETRSERLLARVLIGPTDGGGSWMPNSGVPWDARYQYYTKGWST